MRGAIHPLPQYAFMEWSFLHMRSDRRIVTSITNSIFCPETADIRSEPDHGFISKFG